MKILQAAGPEPLSCSGFAVFCSLWMPFQLGVGTVEERGVEKCGVEERRMRYGDKKKTIERGSHSTVLR